MKLRGALLLLLLSATAHAQTPGPWPGACPSGTASGAVGCMPEAVSPQPTDLVLAWQPGQTPSTRAMQLQQIIASGSYLPLTGGTVTGQILATAPGVGLAVTNNETIGGTLGVTGAMSLGSTLTVPGTTTLLYSTGRDLTISDGGSFASLAVSGTNPLYLRSPFVLSSTAAPQNKTEFSLLGYMGSAIALTGSQTYQLIGATDSLSGSTSAAISPFQFASSGSLAAGGGFNNLMTSDVIGTGAGGARAALLAIETINAASVTSAASVIGAQLQAHVNGNGGGTSGTPAGSAYGFTAQATATASASYWAGIAGGQIAWGAASGATATSFSGLQIALLATHAAHGTGNADNFLSFGGTTGFTTAADYGLMIGTAGQNFPFLSTSTLIGTPSTYSGTNPFTVAYGIDFSEVRFGTAFLKSQGFSVDGSGNETVNGHSVTGNSPLSWNPNTQSPSGTTFANSYIGLTNSRSSGKSETALGFNVSDNSGSDSVGIWGNQLIGSSAGQSWGMAIDTILQTGANVSSPFHTTTEFDFNNNSGSDCLYHCGTLFLAGGGGNQIGAVLWISVTGTPGTYQAAHAILMQSSVLASQDSILDADSAPISYHDTGAHSTASLYLNPSSTPYLLLSASGSTAITTAAVYLPDKAPIGINIAGTRSGEAFGEASVAPDGLVVAGTHAGHGINVNPNGTTPVGIYVQGTNVSTDDISLNSSAPYVIAMAGSRTTGIDAGLATFSGYFLHSVGFTVDGSGNLAALSFKANGSTGVTCSGTPTSSFATVAGIVTHC